MKKYILILFWVMTSFCYAQNEAYTVMAKSDGSLVIPDKATFAKKNELVSTGNLSVFVDLYRDGSDTSAKAQYWTDCELKVLDKDGNIIYFFSTIYFNSKQVQSLHGNDVNDSEAVVYYYVSGEGENACAKPKKRLTNFDSSIGIIENAYDGVTNAMADKKVRITAIQIYPSAKFRDVFLNPENSIIVWRQSPSYAEVDGKGDKLWRPALIQFIR